MRYLTPQAKKLNFTPKLPACPCGLSLPCLHRRGNYCFKIGGYRFLALPMRGDQNVAPRNVPLWHKDCSERTLRCQKEPSALPHLPERTYLPLCEGVPPLLSWAPFVPGDKVSTEVVLRSQTFTKRRFSSVSVSI